MKRKVYIIGYTPDFESDTATLNVCREHFAKAAEQLTKIGYESVNPFTFWTARHPRTRRLLERIFGNKGASALTIMYNLWRLIHSNLVYKIPGWKSSRTANIESCWAYWFDVIPLQEQQRTHIDKRLAKFIFKKSESKPSTENLPMDR